MDSTSELAAEISNLAGAIRDGDAITALASSVSDLARSQKKKGRELQPRPEIKRERVWADPKDELEVLTLEVMRWKPPNGNGRTCRRVIGVRLDITALEKLYAEDHATKLPAAIEKWRIRGVEIAEALRVPLTETSTVGMG